MKRLLYALSVTVFVLACVPSQRHSDIDEEKARAIMNDVSRRNLAYETLTEHDDTLMQQVVAYYDKHGTPNERMEAHYLHGSVLRDLHEAPRAMKAFMDGINAADTTSEDCNYGLLARLYGQKSDLFYGQSLRQKSLEADRKVYKYAALAADTLLIIDFKWKQFGKWYAYKDFAAIADSCWGLLRESERLGKFSHAATHLCTSIQANMEVGRTEDAAKLLGIFEQHSGRVDPVTHECSFPIYYYAKGRVLAALGKYDSAEHFFRKELAAKDWNNRQAACRGLHELYEKLGVTDSALKYAVMQCEAVDSDYQAMVADNLQNLHELYNNSRLQEENDRKELQLQQSKKRMAYACFALVLVLVCSVFFFMYIRLWYRQRISDAELKLDHANAELEERENMLAVLRSEQERAESEAERLRLAAEVERRERETAEQQKTVIERQEELDDLRRRMRIFSKTLRQTYADTDIFRRLLLMVRSGKVAVDEDYREVLTVLSNDGTGPGDIDWDAFQTRFSKMEYHTFLLLRIGLTKTEVSKLTARTQSAVTNMVVRMYFKCNGHDPSTSNEAYTWLLNYKGES